MSITKHELETFFFHALRYNPELRMDDDADRIVLGHWLAKELHDHLLRNAKPGR